MTLLAKDLGFARVNYKLTLTTATNPAITTPHMMYLSMAGMDSPVDGTLVWLPRIIAMSDIVMDSGSSAHLSVIVAAASPMSVYQATWERFPSLHAVLQKWPMFLARCRADLDITVTSNLAVTTTYHLATGRVVCSSNYTPLSMTLEIECTEEVSSVDIPNRVVSDVTPSSSWTLLDGVSAQNTLLTFGNWIQPLPSTIYSSGGVTEWERRNLFPAIGLSIPSATSLPIARSSIPMADKYTLVLLHDNHGTNLREVSACSASLLTPAGNGVARMYGNWYTPSGTLVVGPEAVNANDATLELVQYRMNSFPWVQMPIIPIDMSSAGDYSKAVDGNPCTYATIGVSATARFRMPSGVSNPGRLSLNTVDSGTGTYNPDVSAPAGLKLMMLLVTPVGCTAGTGNVTVKFCFPNGTVWCNTSTTMTAPAAGAIRYCEVALPCANVAVPNTPSAGWLGTRFHNLKFTTSTDGTSSVKDCPLFYLASGEYPFEVWVTNGTTNPVYPVALAVVAGVQLGGAASGNALYKVITAGESMPDAWGRRSEAPSTWAWVGASNYVIRGHSGGGRDAWWGDWPPGKVVGAVDRSGRNVWNRGGGSPTHSSSEAARTPGYVDVIATPRSSLSISASTIIDTPAGLYTGINDHTIDDVLSVCRIVTESYANVGISNIATGSEFGSYTTARNALCAWRTGTTVLENSFKGDLQITNKTPIDSFVDQVTSHCLGLRIRKLRDGKYGFLSWGPTPMLKALQPERVYTAGTSDGTIDPLRQCLGDSESLALNISTSDVQDIVHRISITYCGGRMKAWCNETTSDDGTGSTWGSGGLVPWGGVNTAANLAQFAKDYCEAADAQYQAREFRLDLPWVTEPYVAAMIGLYYLCRMYRPEIRLRMRGNLGFVDLNPGHLVSFSNDFATRVSWGLPFNTYAAPVNLDWSGTTWMVEQVDHRQGGGAGVTHEWSAVMLPDGFGSVMMSAGVGMGGTEQEIFVPTIPEEPSTIIQETNYREIGI